MWDKWVSVVDAVILHLFALGIIFLSMEGASLPLSPSSFFRGTQQEVKVEPALIDENQVLNEVEHLKQVETEKKEKQALFEDKKKEYEQVVVQNQERLKQLRQELKQEEQELAKIKVSD